MVSRASGATTMASLGGLCLQPLLRRPGMIARGLTVRSSLLTPCPCSDTQSVRSMTFGTAVLVSVVFGGICNDKKTDCANWARDGECSGENAVRRPLQAPPRPELL